MSTEATIVVVDTSVVSIIFRQDAKATRYQDSIEGRSAVISFQTVEEQMFGAYLNNWGDRRINELERHLAQYNVIWSNPELVEVSARLRMQRRRAGKELKTADAWIAATALMLGCPLVADDGDFTGIPNLELVRFQ